MSRRSLSSDYSRAALAAALALGLALLAPRVAAAAQGGSPEPISITSERVEADAAGDVVTFSGNVVATQADGMLKAKQLRVFYRNLPGTPGAAGEPRREITRIEAEGAVKFVRGDKVATGERAVYDAAGRTIVLTGAPRVRQDRDWVQGTRVTIYLDEERSVVEGGPEKRVESIIYPNGQPEGTRP